MNRRSKKMEGCVQFPVDSKDYWSSNEGGMSVLLVVVPKRYPFACCSQHVSVLFNNELVGSDAGKGAQALEQVIKRHFPNLGLSQMGVEQLLSQRYMAAVHLGSTGWSGWNDATERYWVCQLKDLNAEGKKIYSTIKQLYRGKGELILQTWLDT